MTKYTEGTVGGAKKAQQTTTKPSREPVRVQFLYMDMTCTRWCEPDGSLSVVGPKQAASIIKPYINLINGLLREDTVLQLVRSIASEGVHDAVMIKHVYIEVLTDRCVKLAKAGLADQWPHVSEQDVRNTLAKGYSCEVPQERKMRETKKRRPGLNAEQERALLLLNNLPGGLTEDHLSAYGITKETMESLALLRFVG
jgi:hypothetical protein